MFDAIRGIYPDADIWNSSGGCYILHQEFTNKTGRKVVVTMSEDVVTIIRDNYNYYIDKKELNDFFEMYWEESERHDVIIISEDFKVSMEHEIFYTFDRKTAMEIFNLFLMFKGWGDK